MQFSDERPMFAVCGRPVEKITRWDSPDTCMAKFAVECHGAVEQCELTYQQIAIAGRDGVQFGVAFNTRVLQSPEPATHE